MRRNAYFTARSTTWAPPSSIGVCYVNEYRHGLQINAEELEIQAHPLLCIVFGEVKLPYAHFHT